LKGLVRKRASSLKREFVAGPARSTATRATQL